MRIKRLRVNSLAFNIIICCGLLPEASRRRILQYPSFEAGIPLCIALLHVRSITCSFAEQNMCNLQSSKICVTQATDTNMVCSQHKLALNVHFINSGPSDERTYSSGVSSINDCFVPGPDLHFLQFTHPMLQKWFSVNPISLFAMVGDVLACHQGAMVALIVPMEVTKMAVHRLKVKRCVLLLPALVHQTCLEAKHGTRLADADKHGRAPSMNCMHPEYKPQLFKMCFTVMAGGIFKLCFLFNLPFLLPRANFNPFPEKKYGWESGLPKDNHSHLLGSFRKLCYVCKPPVFF